ncbi:MAG TPA: GNAT family N-acetyltransferase [Bacteroidales bacterium]|nr:MAG: GNAT family N-acetyltransferase [Bacteroidetes bacterium GWE2_42_24]OFY28858.1 MAG: GNAT family N-acetyltransferase [Bacteroidetes bacterium GWF2_43_11]PKP27917.1 MAG: GNAT family N-acetyltransferase [Bacteroidetes bacterium HGW-Bacteroidetes-22]HAQ65841.1 GNAT family N-acetyltransferase [Bacteroidales bacterium]HBZ67692.1 GNAT family N-acetyltransferase [Bacteroidales bacterium]
MIEIKMYTETDKPDHNEKKVIIGFLFKHLENFGDAIADIEKAVDYALKEYNSFGGFVLTAQQDHEMLGAVVVNQTGMEGYIPENILVYIATHKNHRGKGIGKMLMQEAITKCSGNVALHVEPDNPARFLYEKVGFTTKYIEMRLLKTPS